MAARKTLKIPWEYCECGCKSFIADIAGLHFSYYDDLHGGYWYARSHHPRIYGKKYLTVRAINAEVRKDLKSRKGQVNQWASELENT
jgi:hypothetical protein